eukprot:9433588-Pyramimonas_sp.AAC.1
MGNGVRKHAKTLDERGVALFDPDEIQRRPWASFFAGSCMTMTSLSERPLLEILCSGRRSFWIAS